MRLLPDVQSPATALNRLRLFIWRVLHGFPRRCPAGPWATYNRATAIRWVREQHGLPNQ